MRGHPAVALCWAVRAIGFLSVFGFLRVFLRVCFDSASSAGALSKRDHSVMSFCAGSASDWASVS